MESVGSFFARSFLPSKISRPPQGHKQPQKLKQIPLRRLLFAWSMDDGLSTVDDEPDDLLDCLLACCHGGLVAW